MDLSTLRIAIVGAGLGGLAAARAGALRGAHVTVHEFAHHFGWSDEDIARIDRWWE